MIVSVVGPAIDCERLLYVEPSHAVNELVPVKAWKTTWPKEFTGTFTPYVPEFPACWTVAVVKGTADEFTTVMVTATVENVTALPVFVTDRVWVWYPPAIHAVNELVPGRAWKTTWPDELTGVFEPNEPVLPAC